MLRKLAVILVFVAFLALIVQARPQTQLKWNWQEVILSRNGPSTTTTPRPTFWTTTTLRFLDVAPVVQSGSVGTVEDASLVPRPRDVTSARKLSNSATKDSNISFTLVVLGLLVLRQILWFVYKVPWNWLDVQGPKISLPIKGNLGCVNFGHASP